ncbi:MAG: hypothetical protein WCH10_05045 [bacterium]
MINKIVDLNKKEIGTISGGFKIPKWLAIDSDTTFALALLGTPPLVCTTPAMPLCMLVAGFSGFVLTPRISEYLTNQPLPKTTNSTSTNPPSPPQAVTASGPDNL